MSTTGVPMKIFWSWQSDLRRETNHYLVRDALKDAAKSVAADLSLEPAERPEVDHDTKGLSGSPGIADAIEEKIQDAGLFVADVTPVHRREPDAEDKGRAFPNPNVMLEYGYALGCHGHARIATVANTAFFKEEADLPFDIRHRRGPIKFHLPDSASKDEIKKERARLAKEFVPIIKAAFAPKLQPFEPPADWTTKETWIAFEEPFDLDADTGPHTISFKIPQGPHAFLRIVPHRWEPIPRAHLKDENGDRCLAVGNGRDGSWGNVGNGAASARTVGAAKDVNDATVATYWDAETGNIFAVWSLIASPFQASEFYNIPNLLGSMRDQLRRGLRAIDGTVPDGWAAVRYGLVGVEGATWLHYPGTRAKFTRPHLRGQLNAVQTNDDGWLTVTEDIVLRVYEGFNLHPSFSEQDLRSLGGTNWSP